MEDPLQKVQPDLYKQLGQPGTVLRILDHKIKESETRLSQLRALRDALAGERVDHQERAIALLFLDRL